MARPTEMFRGKAPAAMARMGEGIADAYAKAGAIEGQGIAQMGQSIAAGIQGAASTYAGYKQQKAQVSAQAKALDTFMPYLPQEMQKTLGTQRDQLNNSDTTVAEKMAYYDNTLKMAGNMLGQQFKMQQIGAEQGAATGRTILSENAASARNTETLSSNMERERLKSSVDLLTNPNLIKVQQAGAFVQPEFGIGTSAGGGLYRRGN